jgi:hypothetical protein
MNPVFFGASSARAYFFALAACFLMLSAQGRSQESFQTKSKPKPTKGQPAPAKPAARAEQPEDESIPTEIQIIPLKSANAADAAELLKVMLGMKTPEGQEAGGRYVPIAVDQRTNSLIVSAPADQIDKIRTIVKKLDVISDNEPPAQRPSVIPLRSLEPDETLKEALRLVLVGQGGNFTVDRERKAVIVSCDEKTKQVVTALLEDLEKQSQRKRGTTRSSPQVQVRVVWLVNDVPHQEASKLPDDLKEVLPGLAKLGIDKPRLAAQTMVNVTSGTRFQTRGVARLDSPCQFSVSGQFLGVTEPPQLHIDIRATRPRQAGADEICSLQTQISAPPGQLVVLGMTPTEAATSVFVIQVLVDWRAPPRDG